MESSENKNPGSMDRVREPRDLAQGPSYMMRRARELAQKAGQLQSNDDIEVIFPDKNLEAAVRQELKKDDGPLTRGDLKRLKSFGSGADESWHTNNGGDLEKIELLIDRLRANSTTHFFDLTGLEHAVNLTILNLYGHPITDLSPLATLTKLSDLTLFRCRVRDIEPISSLPNLSRLNIGVNPLSKETVEMHIPQLEARGVKVTYIATNETYQAVGHH